MPPSVQIQSKFPAISHPLSKLGSAESLSVCGSGRFREGSQSAEPRINFTPDGGYERGRNLRSSLASRESNSASLEEIIEHLHEKFQPSNYTSIRKLFRANDPKGAGRVPKEAFSRVLWLLYGYMKTKQVQAVLKRLDLDKKESISFEDFSSRLKSVYSNGTPIKATSNWLKAVNSLSANTRCCGRSGAEDMVSFPPSTARSARYSRGSLRGVNDSASSCWNQLLEKVRQENFNPEDVFPPVCLGEGAYVVPAQFRECLRRLKIPVTDDDLAKIYRRMDGASPYAIHTRKLFESLGLDPETGTYGQARIESPPASAGRMRPRTTSKSTSSKSERRKEFKDSEVRPFTTQGDVQAPIRTASVARPRTSIVKANLFEGDIFDFISKKLEEGQASLQRALESKDVSGNGEITKADLRFIFADMGIMIKITNLEHFLARNGLRRKDGRVNYKLLLRRLQSRSNKSLLHKVMHNPEHMFHCSTPVPLPSEGATASILETKLLDLFQREFLELLDSFRKRDQDDLGSISLSDFREAMEERFGVKFSDDSWRVFIASPNITFVATPPGCINDQGFVNYNDFLAKFDVMLRPATVDADDPWIKAERDEYNDLLEHKKRYLKGMSGDPADYTHRHEPRNLEDLEKVLVDVFLHKFLQMKKEYDLVVREDLRRLDKEKFDYVMFRCGFVLTASELSRLWLSMPITRPIESISFPALLQHVIKLHYSAIMPSRFTRQSHESAFVSYILEKMRPVATAHWSILKKKFRFLDPMGTSRIPKEDLLGIIRGLRPSIIELELYYLVEMLESRIAGKSNYFRMMEYFTKPQPKRIKYSTPPGSTPEPVLSDTTSVIALRPGLQPIPTRQHNFIYRRKPMPSFLTLRNAPSIPPFKRVTQHSPDQRPPKTYPHRYDEENAKRAGFEDKENNEQFLSNLEAEILYRSSVTNLVRHPPSVPSSVPSSAPPTFPRVPANKISSLRRSLRKADLTDKGKLPVNLFRRVLQDYGVSFRDPNELYHFLRHYDTKLSDQVSYERFLKNL